VRDIPPARAQGIPSEPLGLSSSDLLALALALLALGLTAALTVRFARARPAGAAPIQEISRANRLSS
jgi:hypothetical protein